MRLAITAFILVFFTVNQSRAEVIEKTVNWEFEGSTFSGVVYYDSSITKPVPGIAMVPNWKGISNNAMTKAKKIAGQHYVVFLVDMYGSDIRPRTNAEAKEAASAVRSDRPMMRRRINQALNVFQTIPNIPYNSKKTAAIGFCFGGGTVLELARSGTEIAGVVSFHGDLVTPEPATQAKSIKTPMLILHGAADPIVPPEHLSTFEAEMNLTQSTGWQVISFSNAVHSFTNPEANSPAAKWHEASAKRSFILMHHFFDEIFSE